jgi:hypothetical protein
MDEHTYLSPEQAAELIPGMTKNNLAQLRFTGKGPRYLKPTPRTVVYRKADVIAWLEASERASTAAMTR